MATSKITSGNRSLLYDGNVVSSAGSYYEIPINDFTGYQELEIIQVWNNTSQGTVFLEVASGRNATAVITYDYSGGNSSGYYLDARFNSTSGKLEVRFRQVGYSVTLTKTRVFGIK